MGKFGLEISDKSYIVKMDRSFTLFKPNIECETGALKKKGTRLCDKRLCRNWYSVIPLHSKEKMSVAQVGRCHYISGQNHL